MSTDPYKYFRVEARELVEQLASGLVVAEREGTSGSAVSRLLRLAHTLKGAARVVRQAEIANFAHEIEDRLAPFREGAAPIPREGVEGVLALVDAIAARVRALAPATDTSAPAPPDDSFRTLRADIAEMDELLDGVAETQASLGACRRSAGAIQRARRLAHLVGERLGDVRRRTDPRSATTDPIDKAAQELQGLLGEIERRLADDVERVERELQQVRKAGERLRLSPAGTLFGALERVVGDVARTLGKRARFRGEGGEIRLDGPVLGALQSALVQAVRNAVAHGIEPESERVAAGKPAEGEVVVAVSARGSRVVVACRDDGRGVDLAAVRRSLQRKRAPTTSEATAPEELLRLLLEGGISTSAAVTDVAGRGVGLDVVREVVTRLGGTARLDTRPGAGTTLELAVPVSLSSLDALVVEASGVTAAIPVAAVRHTLRLDAGSVAAGPRGDTIAHAGTLIPFLPLCSLFPGELGSVPRVRSGVVVGGNAGLAAFGVERIRGRESLLVRVLPGLTPVDAVVSGLCLDEEGNPQPVLDPERLIEGAQRSGRAPTPAPTPTLPILVVDDSLTTRMLEQSILESAGYSVDLASSGEEALAKARAQRYSLLLVDVEMPGMDGFALLERLRADPELRSVPSVLVTSRQAPEDRARGLEAGARAYIVKSEFDQVTLLERIRALVG